MITSGDVRGTNYNERDYLKEIDRLNRKVDNLRNIIKSCRKVEEENNKMIDALIQRNRYLENKLSEKSGSADVSFIIEIL